MGETMPIVDPKELGLDPDRIKKFQDEAARKIREEANAQRERVRRFFETDSEEGDGRVDTSADTVINEK